MSSENIQQQIKSSQKIFGVILVLTLVSAGAVMGGLSGTAAMALVLGIALVQGLLILGSLMHLKGELPSMKGLFVLCAFFIAFLLCATTVAYKDQIVGTAVLDDPAPAAETEEEH